MLTGYNNPKYAESLSEWGTPRELIGCGGWILERSIPKSAYRDAMGCYPLFFCQDWSRLQNDLDDLGDELVSLVLVTDPFGNFDETYLQSCFKDVFVPFKDHYVINLKLPLNEIGGKHHRKHGRRALRKVQVEICQDPSQFVDTWMNLYDHLIKRHQIKGIRAFSRIAFSHQFNIPGTIILQAIYEDQIVGAQVYFSHNEFVYCHLGTSSELGYKVGAIYALDAYSIEFFKDKASWIDLGGGVGVSNNVLDGLSQYKKGWTNETRKTFLCGKILNQQKYSEIIEREKITPSDYFPVYRNGEYD